MTLCSPFNFDPIDLKCYISLGRYLLLSLSRSVTFLLNLMLFLQPLLEPNGEKGSESHTHTHTQSTLSIRLF